MSQAMTIVSAGKGIADCKRPQKRPPTLAGGGLNRLNSESLLLDLVYAIASLGLGGLDLEAVLLGGGGEETPD